MLRYLLSIRYLLVLLLLSVSSELFSQAQFPHKDGERARYDVKIDIKKAYISGVCMMMKDEGIVKASIVNEFGLSAVDFTYNPSKDKVKILNVMSKMDKWYIRRVLRKDFRYIMHQLSQGIHTYENKKQHITYTFNPLKDDIKE